MSDAAAASKKTPHSIQPAESGVKWGEDLSARLPAMQRAQALVRGLVYNLYRLVGLGVRPTLAPYRSPASPGARRFALARASPQSRT